MEPKSYQDPDSPNIEEIYVTDPFYKISRGVAQLFITNSFGRYPCSGFLVSDQYLLTNNHCVSKNTPCKNIEIYFDNYQFKKNETNDRSYCDVVVDTNYSLDWALIKLKNPEKNRYIFNGLKNIESIQPEMTTTFIIHHPEGLPKKITRTNCKILKIPSKGNPIEYLSSVELNYFQNFTHVCDTAFGSSGAPVLDMSGKLIGIHQAGFKQNSKKDRFNQGIIGEYAVSQFIGYLKNEE